MPALALSREVFDVLSKSLGFVPIIGENLKSAAELASKICEEIQTVQENRKGYQQLSRQVQGLLLAISTVIEQEKDQNKKLTIRKPLVENLIGVLEEIEAAVHERVPSRPTPTKRSSRIFATVRRAITDTSRLSADKEKIKNMQQKLQDIMNQFEITTLVLTESKVERILGRLSQFAERTQRVEEMQRKTLKDADIALLKTLEPVKTASWTTLPSCTPDTRVSVLHDIDTWAGAPDGPFVFWLNGLAGTGKSTIAVTACESLDKKHLLGASFFISRQQADSRDAQGIVRSIAHELASRDGLIAEALCAKLRVSSASVPQSLEKQIAEFIITPARELAAHATLVIVIDALDESFLDARGRPGGDLLPLLVCQLLTLSGRLKLLITSRNEIPIQDMFKKLSTTAQQQITELHNLDSTIVQSDIRTYLVRSFDTIREDRSSELPFPDWPDDDDLNRLVLLSGLLFIYAATAVRFLMSRQESPVDRLSQLLEQQETTRESTSRHDDLDELYTRILRDTVETSKGVVDSKLVKRLHDVVTVIVLAQIPVHIDALAVLSGVKLSHVHVVLHCLASILLMGKDDEPVRIFHPSFPDFMTDLGRCKMASMCVNPAKDHGTMTLRCLMILNQTLHYDMCDIRNPEMANGDVPDLAERLRKKVPSWNAVRYACSYWPTHLVESEKPCGQLLQMLVDFCHKHLFHWLEVLSLIEDLPSLEGKLLNVIEWCKMHAVDSKEHPFSAADLLYDTVRTFQAYHIPMRSHALQIYHSAFVTMPKCSLQQILAQGDMPSSLCKLISSRASHWGPSTRILEGYESPVLCIAFSPDGRRIAFGSGDRKVRIWNAVSFEELANLEGHQGLIFSVAFSPDSTHIASGSEDGTVRIWDAVSYEELAKLEGHQGLISSVVFSPDGTHIASGSLDETVRIWDAVSFEELAQLEGHQGPITCVAFSPDGTRIASSSSDYNVRIWNAVSFEELATLEGHYDETQSVAFSPNGTQIASGSDDYTVRIWNAVSFEELAKLEGHRRVITSVAFSPDGKCIASGSHDYTIRRWNTTSFEELTTFEGHHNAIRCVAFSPDGTHIASGSEDCTLRIWKAVSFEELAKLKGHQFSVWSITISPDGTRIASSSYDRTVRIWNAASFEELATLEVHQGPSWSVAFSPDGTHIASGSYDHTVRLWNAVSFEELAKLEGHQGHIRSVAFSPDGTYIASGSDDCTVRIWNAVSFEELAKLEGHQGYIRSVAFSPDGTHIVSGSDDCTVRIWSVASFQELTKLEGHGHSIMSVAFSPDSNIISSRDAAGERCAWTCSRSNNDIWNQVELPSRIMDDTRFSNRFALTSSGWLQSGAGSLLWLPVERRGDAVESLGRRVVVGGATGAMTILELPGTQGHSLYSITESRT